MGEAGTASVGKATFFGFVSSSCSFAALATTRAILAKGAGLVPALAFLLASTNLVVELGIVIAIFLRWQFVVGEYVGGVLLIAFMWVIVNGFAELGYECPIVGLDVALIYPRGLVSEVRERLESEEDDEEVPDWRRLARSREGWTRIAHKYVAEWRMVWKDVTVGFTVAGVIAVFVPDRFFEALFVGSGQDGGAGPLALLEHAIVAPIAAFFTFIGSMGNIPLAAVLFGAGVSFAGIMAFIFSDLVVFPVVRISAEYYGWKLALYIVGVFFVAAVATALVLHAGFALLGLLPEGAQQQQPEPASHLAFDYTWVFNGLFLALSGVLVWLHRSDREPGAGTPDREREAAPA